jgi:hypothetical protein
MATGPGWNLQQPKSGVRVRRLTAARMRRLTIEPLEARALLDGAPNDAGDGNEPQVDAAALVEYINYFGMGPASRDPSGLGELYDLNDDGNVTAMDVLQAINLKNAAVANGGDDGGKDEGDDEEVNDSTGTGPPDTMGGVGPGQIVEMLNSGYTVYDKATRKIVAPTISLGKFWNAALARASANEVQRLAFSGQITGGDFTLGYGPLTSAPIQWSDQANVLTPRIQSALDGMFGAGTAVAQATTDGDVEIDFGGALAGLDLVGVTVNNNLAGGSVAEENVADGGGNEVQKLWFADDVTGGDFLLQFPGAPSQTVEWIPDAATLVANVRQKLDLMFGTGNTGAVMGSGREVNVVFGGVNAGQDVPRLTITSHLLTSRPIVVEQTANPPASMVERLTFSPEIPEWSSIVLGYETQNFGPFTLSDDAAATTQRMQAALNDFFGIGNSTVSSSGPRQFDITFGGELANTPLHSVDINDYLGMTSTSILTPGSGNDVQDLSMQPLFQLSGDLGTLTLTLTLPGGQTAATPPIAVNSDLDATRQSVESALAAPELLGPGNVRVLNLGSGDFEVVFRGQYGRTSIPLMTVTSTRDAFLQVGHLGSGEGNEVQRLAFRDAPDDAGSFELRLGERSSEPIALRADPAELAGNIQAALLGMFGPSNVTVSPSGVNQFDISFVGSFARTNIDLLSSSDPSVDVAPIVDGSGREMQQITLPQAVSGGSFAISTPGGAPQTIDAADDLDELAANAQAALDGMYGTTSGSPVAHNALAIVYSPSRIDVVFSNQLDERQTPLMVVANNGLTMDDAVNMITTAAPNGNVPTVTDPRVVFDASSGRWFASGLGHTVGRADSVVLAVSKTANPLDGWTGFFIDETFGEQLSPDFPQLGYDAEGVYIVTQVINFEAKTVVGCLVSAPKADLLSSQPHLDNATVIPKVGVNFGYEPVLDNGPADGLEPIISSDARHNVLNPAGPGAAQIQGPVDGIKLEGPYREWLLYPTGDFTLTYGDLPTQTVPFNSDFSVMRASFQAALDSLLGPGGAGIFDCFYCGSENPIQIVLGPKIPSTGELPIRLDGSQTPSEKLENDTIPDNEVQHLSLEGAITGGSFTIQKPGAPPVPVAWSSAPDALVANLRSALETLFGVGNVALIATADNEFDVVFGGALDRQNVEQIVVDGSGLTGASPESSMTTIIDGANVYFGNIPPYAAQPNTSVLMAWGDPWVRSSVVKVGGSFWRASVVIGGNQYGVRWAEIDATTNRIKQSGTISDPELSFFMPSIAVNAAGDVVMGFSGSGAKQYPSAYYAVGHTVDGHTTFDQPRLLQAGNGNFFGRWGDYSATVVDPTDPTLFWTFQEYAASDNTWGVKIGAIRAASPDPDEYLMMHNPVKPMDVSGDQHVAPSDALDVINYLNAYGSGVVPLDALGAPYCDVNGDEVVSPGDALAIINVLNANQSGEGEGEARSEVGGQRSEAGVGDLLAMLAVDAAMQTNGARTKRV